MVVEVYVARNGYNGGHRTLGFESRFTEVILKLGRIICPGVGFELFGQGITLDWLAAVVGREIRLPGKLFWGFCLS